MAVASLVLGIVSIVLTIMTAGVYGWVSALLGIVGIILGIQGKKNPEKAGLAQAGFIVSIVGLVIGAAMYLACVAFVGGVAESLNQMQ